MLLRSAGVKNYLYYWLLHLRRHANGHTIKAFPFLGNLGRLDHEQSVLRRWQTIPRLAFLYFVNVPHNPALDLVAGGFDVFHATNQLHHSPRRSKVTATLHDLTAVTMPEVHTEANVRADRSFIDNIVRHAHGLIAVSESTRQDAVRVAGIDARKIEVIYSGVSEAFFQVTPEERTAVAKKYQLSKPYVLFVGTIEPRKNLDRLLDAWAGIRPSLRGEFELVIAGPSGWGVSHTVNRLRSAPSATRYLGYVPEDDLPGLTAAATAFAYPSLYEGFGFPVVQAMASGVPVLTSNVSSLPEITGGAAVLVAPQSIADITGGLERLLLGASLRQELSENGRRRASEFRWETCAERSIRFFEKVAGAAGA